MWADALDVISAAHLETATEAPTGSQVDRARVVIWASAVGFSLGFWVIALTAIF